MKISCKFFFVFISFFWTTFSNAQDSTEVVSFFESDLSKYGGMYWFSENGEEECLKGIWRAWTDVQDSNFHVSHWGLLDLNSYERTMLYFAILEENYGIIGTHKGCVIKPESSCYNAFMMYKIGEIFGKDIFEKTWLKTDSLWASGVVDKEAEFPGGFEEFRKFVSCNIRLLDENKGGDGVRKSVKIMAEIDAIGKVSSYYFFDKNFINTDYEVEINRLIKLIPNWNPAIRDKRPIVSKTEITFLFDEKMVEYYCK